jgi:TctA family transporter
LDLLSHLALGFGVALTPVNLLYALIGVVLGTLIGVLPGIGPVATIAMLLPTTYALQPVSALIMLAGIYYGAQYGGSTTAILINMPGESSSVVTCLDGHQMALKGQAGAALTISALGSFFAGTVATILVASVAIPLSELALKFGPAEYFSLMVLGLIGAVVLASGSLIKAIAMIILGLLLGIVGTDVNSGVARFSFGVPELTDGIGVVTVAMGLFGFAEIISNLEVTQKREMVAAKIKGFFLSKEQFRKAWPAVLRGTSLGSVLGVLPGGGAMLSAFASYTLEKKISDNPGEFGKGAIQGVAGPESANNAGAQTSFIPLLTLGIPENAGHGADGGRDDDPQHPAGTSGDDVEPGPVLGPDRVDVGRQPDARSPQSAAHRHVDQAAAGALPHPVSRDPAVLLDRRVQHQQHERRHHVDGVLRSHRHHLRQTRLRAGAPSARLRAGPDDGGEPAPRIAALAGRPHRLLHATAVTRNAGSGGPAGAHHRATERAQDTRSSVPGRVGPPHIRR